MDSRKDTCRKYNKQPKSTLFKSSSYKKESNTLCCKANRERTLLEISSTRNNYTNVTKVF